MDTTLVRDLMSTDLTTTSAATKVLEASKIFNETKFSGIPVVDEQQKLVGLITEYNLVGVLLNNRKNLENLTVGEIMEKEPITILFDDSFERALEIMHQHHRVNPIPVIDNDNKLVGVVSRYDLLKLVKLLGHT